MTIGQTPIEYCDSYCYLGTTFSRSGSFSLASHTLCGKARSAMYSLLKNTYKHGSCDVYLILDLFDKMVSPVATYNSEVWGASFIPVNPTNNALLDFGRICKYPVEKMHGKFIKRVLGVGDKSSNWAVYSLRLGGTLLLLESLLVC